MSRNDGTGALENLIERKLGGVDQDSVGGGFQGRVGTRAIAGCRAL